MAQTVFNRMEKKFVITQMQFEAIWQDLMKYMQVDSYGGHTICNVYYDTPTDELIRKSIEKPVYKEKLRLRSYGVPAKDSKVYLEIKKKYKGIVNKRRIELTLEEAYDYLEGRKRPEKECQILTELDYFLSYYDLSPKAYIAYERVALFGNEDPDFRVTFDTNVQGRREALRLEAGSAGEYILELGKHIMEVKITNATPIWFVKILAKHKIFGSSFSKYGTFYKQQRMVTKQKKEHNSYIEQHTAKEQENVTRYYA